MPLEILNLAGLVRVKERLEAVARIADDPARVEPLMEAWRAVIIEDNRKGVLTGLDKNDVPLAKVTYRTGVAKPTKARGKNAFGGASGAPKPGVGGNLAPSEYQKLAGPPLAPRREQSRVIANFVALPTIRNGSDFIAACTWYDVVRPDGEPLLPPHFEGSAKAHLPKRDLRGVRQWGKERALGALREWIKQVLGR